MIADKRPFLYGRVFTSISFAILGLAFASFIKKCLKKKLNEQKRNSTSNSKKFYAINDLNFIKEILKELKSQNGCFVSQLIQPYILIDSKCRYKITKLEHTELINVLILKCYKNTRQTFVDTIVTSELKRFLNEKYYDKNNQSFFELNEIFGLTFKIGTIYLKSMFKNSSISENYKLNDSDKSIFFHLIGIQENFSFNLFVNPKRRIIRRYSKNLKNLMKLIDIEYKDVLDEIPQNVRLIKFLFIKNFYLDLLVVFSVISNFLRDMSVNDPLCSLNLVDEMTSSKTLFLKSDEVWKYSHLKESINFYYVKHFARDLLCIKKNTFLRFNFFENDFIGLNLPTSKVLQSNYKYYANAFDLDDFYLDSNNLSLNLTYCIVYFLLKNFALKNNVKNGDDYDKKSIDSKFFSVYKNFRIKLD
jgi:hypothetical protein